MHTIYQEAMAIKDQVIGWRRAIHQNPEVGMDLPNTVALVYDACLLYTSLSNHLFLDTSTHFRA